MLCADRHLRHSALIPTSAWGGGRPLSLADFRGKLGMVYHRSTRVRGISLRGYLWRVIRCVMDLLKLYGIEMEQHNCVHMKQMGMAQTRPTPKTSPVPILGSAQIRIFSEILVHENGTQWARNPAIGRQVTLWHLICAVDILVELLHNLLHCKLVCGQIGFERIQSSIQVDNRMLVILHILDKWWDR